jgi:collagenase-like PrtC family protease
MNDLENYVNNGIAKLKVEGKAKQKQQQANSLSITTAENYKIVKALFSSNLSDEARIEILTKLNF